MMAGIDYESEVGQVIPGRYSLSEDGYIVEPQAHIRGGAGMGCFGSYAMLLIAVPIGLLLGSVIILLALFVPWVFPVAIGLYLAVKHRGVVTGYSRGRGR